METVKDKLPEEFKSKWVAGLRSGKFKQGSGQLMRIIDGDCRYCCIGVAAVANGLDLNDDGMDVKGEKSGNTMFYPFICKYIGRGKVNELVRMNDKEDMPFDKIADYIEANL